MLEVDLTITRGDFTLDAQFQTSAGVTALFGQSGSGKSTLIHALAGLTTSARGTIHFNGRPLLDTSKSISVPPRARQFVPVFQDALLFPHLSVKRNLTYGQWAGARAANRSVNNVITLLGLEKLRTRKPSTLSGGERQRVALGRALLADPKILLLDEPLASLDQQRKAEILPYLKRVCEEGIPILYVSHAMDEVLQLAETVICLDNGQVTDHQSISDFAASHDAEHGLYP